MRVVTRNARTRVPREPFRFATYVDEALTVIYSYKNRAGKPDRKRDIYDKAEGVQTLSKRYRGRPAVGSTFFGADCTRRGLHGPGGEGDPPLAGECYYDKGGRRVTFDRAGARRASQVPCPAPHRSLCAP